LLEGFNRSGVLVLVRVEDLSQLAELVRPLVNFNRLLAKI
jgi:hypothetical protein